MSTTETLIKIPSNAMPLFIRWLKEHQQDMEEQYDKLERTGCMRPASRNWLAQEIEMCTAAIYEMEKVQTD
tara:strand:+ start:964 stop:1176 length:213 start_codon:yes stop_codon:yes gene_type:complete